MMNINEVVENQRLKELLKKIDEDNSPELENEILEEIIMKVNFLSYINSNELESTFGNINFNVLKTDDNKTYLPAFTDLEELSKWGIPEKMNTITLNFDDYAEIILDNDSIDGLVINPFGDYYIIPKEDLKDLKEMKKERLKVNEVRIEANSKILIDEPKHYPTMMMEEIKNCCNSLGNINKAWLLEMMTEKDKSWLLILDFEGDKNYIFSKISQAARNYLGNMYLDMLPYEDDFARNSVQNYKAFYSKNK
ncbi:enhanced serine sensitivity protein SseB [Fusobacterium polymorphum]|uniref:enhanced serine sensitivity protein SseB n=1 Tax=Fusobacterium nucleatum subsp. polymorphum TaxID=76857 RepID=UPI0030090DD4